MFKPKSKNRRKWRSLLIRREIQICIVMYILFYEFLIMLVFFIATLNPLHSGIEVPNNLYAQYYSAKYFLVILNRSAYCLCGLTVFGLLHSLIISHRFFGPLVNFNRIFEKISRGDFTDRIFLRKKDFLKKEADQVNKMIDVCSSQILTLKNQNDTLIAALDGMTLSGPTYQEERRSLHTAKEQASLMRDTLNTFNVRSNSSQDSLNFNKSECLNADVLRGVKS